MSAQLSRNPLGVCVRVCVWRVVRAIVCSCLCGPAHEYSVLSAGAVTMTELMALTDVECVCVLRV